MEDRFLWIFSIENVTFECYSAYDFYFFFCSFISSIEILGTEEKQKAPIYKTYCKIWNWIKFLVF